MLGKLTNYAHKSAQLFIFLSPVQGVHLPHWLRGARTAAAGWEEDVQRCGGFAQAEVRKSVCGKSVSSLHFISSLASGEE